MVKRLPNDTPFQLPETEWELTFSDDFACFDRTKWKCNTMVNPENPARNGIRNNAFYTDDEDIVFAKDGIWVSAACPNICCCPPRWRTVWKTANSTRGLRGTTGRASSKNFGAAIPRKTTKQSLTILWSILFAVTAAVATVLFGKISIFPR
ncbi:MAG: hypothetical protein ACI4LI_03420 [Candidatus Fimenecus sp.]